MRVFVSLILSLMVAGAIAAGCISNPNTVTPAPTTIQTSPSPAITQTMYFTLGDQYLKKSYSFQSEKDIQTEQFRITNDPWGIEFNVNSTNVDPQYTWFEMKITNMDTNQTETVGYGRTYSLEKHQIRPMYIGGPYKFEMRGDRVKVDVNIAKRNP
jgi:hypothetical protein